MKQIDFCLKYFNKKIPATPEMQEVLKEIIDAIQFVDNRIIIDEPSIYQIDASLEELNEAEIRGFYSDLDGSIYISNYYPATSIVFFHDLLHEVLHYIHSYNKVREVEFNIVFEEALNEFFTLWILANCKKYESLNSDPVLKKEFIDLFTHCSYAENVITLSKYIETLSFSLYDIFYEYANANMKFFLTFIPIQYFEFNHKYFS